MTDKAFQRTPVYALEKPASGDIDQGFTQIDFTVREKLWQQIGKPQSGGFFRGGLQPVVTSPLSLGILLKAGLAFQYNATDLPLGLNGGGPGGAQAGLDDPHPYKPIVLTADLTVVVPTAPGANSRIDLIEVAYTRSLNNLQARQFLNTSTDSFSPANVAKTLDPTVDSTLAYYAAAATPTTALAYKSGVVAGSPVAPAVDAGYMAVAYITVGTNVTQIVAANISDQRCLLALGMYLGRQIFTATGTYTPTPNTRAVHVRMIAGGGAGGGAATTISAQASAGAGGSSGQYQELNITGANAPQGGGTIPITGGAVVIGAGGTGVAGTIGNNGNDTTVVINGTTYDAAGGDGAGTVASLTPPQAIYGSVPLSNVAGADFYYANQGQPGVTLASTAAIGGAGASSPFGSGGSGISTTTTTAGVNAASSGYGAGGGGGANAASQSQKAGGNGSNGLLIIDEYI